MKLEKKDREAIEFLPDALAIAERPLPLWASWGLVGMLVLFTLFFLGALFMKLDVIVVGQGKLIAESPTVQLKPLESSVIRKINVSPGQFVKKGETLATFDPVFSSADINNMEAEVATLEAEVERLEKESASEELVINDQSSPEQRQQKRLFDERKAYYAQRNSYFESEMERLAKSRKSLEENLALQQTRLARFKDIEDMLKSAGKAVAPRDRKEAEISRVQLEAEISDKKNQINVLQTEAEGKKAEWDSFISGWQMEIADNLAKQRKDLITARQQLAKAARRKDYIEMLAPEDAIVHDIARLGSGSAIREGETMFVLTPVNKNLEAEVEIRASDIGKVKPGSRARLKISAWPFQKYGALDGEVRVISRDSFLPESEKGGQPFYKARIDIRIPEKSLLRPEDLLPGMDTQADIRAGKRTLWEYLVHPLTRALSESMREP